MAFSLWKIDERGKTIDERVSKSTKIEIRNTKQIRMNKNGKFKILEAFRAGFIFVADFYQHFGHV